MGRSNGAVPLRRCVFRVIRESTIKKIRALANLGPVVFSRDNSGLSLVVKFDS